MHAVRTVAAGQELLAPEATRRLIRDFVSPATRLPASATARAHRAGADVLRLVAAGRSNTDIATEMFLAESTVKTHINRLFAKLGVRPTSRPSYSPTSPDS